MPRAFSSGALLIWSNADASLRFGYLSCRTLVIAAVSVFLPWSMCPMVPMLTCGLVRSNLALATGAPSGFLATRSRGDYWGLLVCADRACRSILGAGGRPSQNVIVRPGPLPGGSLPACLLDDLVGDRLRRLGVGVELHRVGRLARGLRPEVTDVAEHLRQRHQSLDDLVAVQVVHRLDLPATGVQVT